jgi:hypothetical protein
VSLLVAVLVLSQRGYTSFSASSASLAIDGVNSNRANATSVSVGLSTTQPQSVIIALVSVITNTSLVPTVTDDNGLSWHIRESKFAPTENAQLVEYYATAPTVLTSDGITVYTGITQNRSIDVKVFGISGANFIDPFDSNPNLPAVGPGYGTDPSVMVTTTNANDMILGLAYFNGNPIITPGTGFSSIGTFKNTPVAYAQYEIVTSTQSGLSVNDTVSPPQNWIMFGDAVQAAPSATTTTSTSSTTTSTSSSTTSTTSSTSSTSTSSTTPSAPPPTSTTTTTTTSSSSSGGHSGGSISLTLAMIIAAVVIVVAIAFSFYLRRRV